MSNNPIDTIIFDIETDGLLDTITKIHCISLYDCNTDTIWQYTDSIEPDYTNYYPLQYGLAVLSLAKRIVGHNILRYDIPAIQKLYPNFKVQGQIFDTLLMSKLTYPDIGLMDDRNIRTGKYPKELRGKYKLEAWGYRLGELKGEYCKQEDAWNCYSEDMQKYCNQDVMVTKKLYDKLLQHNIPEETINLEHRFAEIIFNQEQHGIQFNKQKAIDLDAQLRQDRYDIEQQLKVAFPPETIETTFIPKANNKTKGYIKGQPFIKKELVEFNPSSRQMIVDRLIKKYNWKPTRYTEPTDNYPEGQPVMNEEVLDAIDYPEVELLKKYFVINKIIGFISEGSAAWLKLEQDNVIHGSVDTCGTVTGRCSHNHPNLAQVPSADAQYGKECRELFEARTGYKLIGCDASSLELCCLAHYMAKWDKGKYAQIILEGDKKKGTDIHTLNQKAAGLPTRDNAKTFIYGFIYGAGDEKVGKIIGKGKTEGKSIKSKFLTKIPALKKLINSVKETVRERGYLKGIDKRKLKVRDDYKALNVLLQSAGAIAMKKALCIFVDGLVEAGYKVWNWQDNVCKGQQDYDIAFVLNIHDEYQAEVKPELVDKYMQLAPKAITKAGEYFGFRCKLDGESKEGNNWYDTH
jgi:DNA polymerase-1